MKVQRLSGKPSATQRLLIPPGALLQFSPHHTTTKAAMQARINFMVELKKILLQLPAGKSCCLESCYLKTWRFRRMVSNYFDQATILVLDRHFLQEERKEHVCVTSIGFKRVRASRSLRDSHSPICFYITV